MKNILDCLNTGTSFLHVGFPKCASSLFESSYFTEENGFLNLANDPAWGPCLEYGLLSAQTPLWKNWTMPSSVEIPDRLVPGVSSATFLTGVDYETSLRRWREIAPKAKVLIVIRNQLDFIYSGYGQRILSGYFRGIDEHVRELIWDMQQSVWGRLFYDRIYEITKEYFDDVVVLPLERMQRSADYVKELNSFFGVQNGASTDVIRPSLNEPTLKIIRAANTLFRHGVGSPQMSVLPSYEGGVDRFRINRVPGREPSRARRKIINGMAKRIGQRIPSTRKEKKAFALEYQPLFEEWFGESNRRMEKLAEINLRQHCYVGL